MPTHHPPAATPEAAAAQVDALDVRARRIATPCGDGAMVWRIWGEGPPVVLGHGAQGAWSHWIRTIAALVDAGYRVIAPDLPGHGDSADPATPDHPGISAALAAGLEQVLEPGESADLVGFSFGGVAFAWMTSVYPQRVRRLILVGCGGLGTPHGHIDLRRIGGLAGEERREALRANLCGLMLHHRASADDLAIHLLVRNARRGSAVQPQHLVMPDRLAAVLPHVAVPVDAIWGALDRPHPDPALQKAVIRQSHPACDFRVVADAGHWVMYERAGAFNAVLADMLEKPRAR